MYRTILLCYDGSTEGRNALREGAEVALCMHAQVHLLAIIRSTLAVGVPEGVNEMAFRDEDSNADAVLREGVNWLRARGLDARGEIVFGNAIEQITLAVQRIRPELIVVGHRRRSRLARWWSEGEDATLLERVPCSVLVAVARERQGEEAAP
jgi:nucleotide-binding universal stress UspA family protein